MAKLELFKLIEKLGLNGSMPTESAEEQSTADEILVENCKDSKALLADLKKAGRADFVAVYDKNKIEKIVFAQKKRICIVKPDDDFLREFCE